MVDVVDSKWLLGVRNNFDRSAATYYEHAIIQREIANELIEGIGRRSFSKGIDIGCASGEITALLLERRSIQKMWAVDLSENMIREAKKRNSGEIYFLQREARDVHSIGVKFDLIFSNMVFQWFDHLEEYLYYFVNLLETGGILTFSIVLEGSFSLFKDLLTREDGDNRLIPLVSFGRLFEQLGELCSNVKGLKLRECRAHIKDQYFENGRDMHEIIKKMGVGRPFLNRKMNRDLYRRYRDLLSEKNCFLDYNYGIVQLEKN